MRGYPRPLLQRPDWHSLDGPWSFALDQEGRWRKPADVRWERQIEVPFAPETKRSGVHDTTLFRAAWYRRSFTPPRMDEGQRLILHFGAVDYEATVWVNGQLVARHEGGYTPFSADVTDVLVGTGGPQDIVVRAFDDPLEMDKPRGKQEWQLEPHSIWYPRTSGIWQSVWYEVIGDSAIQSLRWTPLVEKWQIALRARVDGEREGLKLRVVLSAAGRVLADDTYLVVSREVHRTISMPDPGIDSAREELLWRPGSPTLIAAALTLLGPEGQVLDEVNSYTAMRSATVSGNRFMLNGRPYHLRMVLDQGYWPDTGMTAPDDDGLRRDVELARAMGFNGVRKHQKVEDPRYLYWADCLGLLVWEEMPSPYRFSARSVQRVSREWLEVLERDASHPCIVTWVPFNESWGVPDLPSVEQQRRFVAAIRDLTRAEDPTRPVISNDGWESPGGDLLGIHDYEPIPARLAMRYQSWEAMAAAVEREHPGGRMVHLTRQYGGEPVVLSEFGGIALSSGADTDWGYSRVPTTETLAERYRDLLAAVHTIETLAGFCYTQFCDTYQETNGLLWPDRTPKFPLEEMRAINRPHQAGYQWPWQASATSREPLG